MKKKILSLMLAAAMLSASVNVYAADGRKDGSTLIASVRDVYEELGYTVTWDAETATAFISKDDSLLEIPKNGGSMTANGNELDAEPRIINDRLYLPAELIAKSIGGELSENTVTADGKSSYITISEEKSDGKPWVDSSLKENIDTSVSLKDDYYMAVNGDWILNNEIPSGYLSYDTLTALSMRSSKKIRDLLKDKTINSHDAELVRDLYSAQLDWEGRKNGLDDFRKEIERIEQISSIDELNAYITNADDPHSSFFAFALEPDINDTSKYTVAITPASLILYDSAEYSKRTDFGERLYSASHKLSVNVMKRVGISEADAEQYFEDAMKYDEAAAKYIMTYDEQNTPDAIEKTNNDTSLESIDQRVGAYPMKEIISVLGYADSKSFKESMPGFTENFGKLYTEENLDILKACILTKYIINSSAFLDKDSLDDYNTFDSEVYDSDNLSYEDFALQVTIDTLYEPLTKVYLQKYDCEKTKSEVTDLCREIVGEYKQILSSEDWLSEETRAKAVEKLDALTVNVAYPDRFCDYSSLDLSGKNLWECQKAIRDFELDRRKTLVNSTPDTKFWELNPLEANAYYDLQQNSINILLGILDDPVYYDGISKEELYANIGIIAGHEISHAFDPTGSMFDKNGDLSDWWTAEDKEAFALRTQKLIDYYDNIEPFPGVYCKGELLQGEAVADLGAMKCMLEIAKKDPDFDYDKFFRSYAFLWANISTRTIDEYIIQTDTHPLCYLRINAVVQQYDEFNETYGISEGDGMYIAKEDRITVW